MFLKTRKKRKLLFQVTEKSGKKIGKTTVKSVKSITVQKTAKNKSLCKNEDLYEKG